MIERQLQQKIESRMFAGKAIIVIGARQVGKSTLFRMILEEQDCKTLQLNCDEPEVKDMLTNINTSELRLLIADNKIVVIDEAQRVENIGMTLKRITDNFPAVQLLVRVLRRSNCKTVSMSLLPDASLNIISIQYQRQRYSTVKDYWE